MSIIKWLEKFQEAVKNHGTTTREFFASLGLAQSDDEKVVVDRRRVHEESETAPTSLACWEMASDQSEGLPEGVVYKGKTDDGQYVFTCKDCSASLKVKED